jgi:hypothetical protein
MRLLDSTFFFLEERAEEPVSKGEGYEEVVDRPNSIDCTKPGPKAEAKS